MNHSFTSKIIEEVEHEFNGLLNDEKDIQAVLTDWRQRHRRPLRSVLASLDSKQQALIIGHAVPIANRFLVIQDPRLRRSVLQCNGLCGRPARRGAAGEGRAGCGGVVWGVGELT